MKKILKYNYILPVFVCLFAFLLLFQYLIYTLVSAEGIELGKFLYNFLISLAFTFIIALVDCFVVLRIHRSRYLSSHLFVRIIVELSAIIVIAAFFVAFGNAPFINNKSFMQYLVSFGYFRDVIAGTLFNLFAVAMIEFFVVFNQNRKLSSENMKIQYMQLKGQMNPHFLFNSLNTLVSLIYKDQDTAASYTRKLSDVYRYVLSNDLCELVTLENESVFIDNYLEILHMRFGCGLKVNKNIREEDFRKKLPPMSIQVLIENAVKHNVVSAASPLTIDISSDSRYLTVSNNIKSRIGSSLPGMGIGLSNLKKRYLLLSDREIEVMNNEKQFVIKLPLL